MNQTTGYDVIIIGGSYAGMSAALALGRSLRKALVIDSGNPCNRQTPHSHNFIGFDGMAPADVKKNSQNSLMRYQSVTYQNGLVEDVVQKDGLFEVITSDNQLFTAKKILFATGLTDTIPNIPGFAECWGISVLHCPYCHGYEARYQRTGIIGNGDMGFELAKTISHWTSDLTLYTNGASTLSPEQVLKLNKHNIKVVENNIEELEHENGCVKRLHFTDTETDDIEAIYTQLPFIQQCPIPEKLGCELTEKGFIKVDKCLETTVPGVFAAGDCLSLFRSIAHAVASGNKAGAVINKCLIEEEF